MIRKLTIAITIALLAATALPAQNQPGHAQEKGQPPGKGRMMSPETRELLEQVLLARISSELALDDEQTILLVRRFAEFRERLGELYRERNQRMRDLKKAVQENTDTESIESKLDSLMQIDDEITAARREAMQLSGLELTAWQRARLYIFLGDFEGDMRRLVQRARQREGAFFKDKGRMPGQAAATGKMRQKENRQPDGGRQPDASGDEIPGAAEDSDATDTDTNTNTEGK